MISSADLERKVGEHYEAFGQRDAILAALERRGIPLQGLTPDQLAPFDQFHTGGAAATQILADMLAPRSDQHVLDVGCGLGGPARMLSRMKGCRVTGIDLAAHFVDHARFFTQLTRQSDLVTFHLASAVALPFADSSFDGLWQLHVGMNVPDKQTMYSEMFRALKPGGRLAIHDPVRGTEGEFKYPVPWATQSSMSFLSSRAEVLDYLRSAGFKILKDRDATSDGLAWYAELDAARRKNSPTLHSELSPLDVMRANHRDNLASGVTRIKTLLAQKPL
ncbi:MAG: methyltransferase domain-containing protein [Rhodospirillaceae bacterium]